MKTYLNIAVAEVLPNSSSMTAVEALHSCSWDVLNANDVRVREGVDARGALDPSEVGLGASAKDPRACLGRRATASDSSPCVLRK